MLRSLNKANSSKEIDHFKGSAHFSGFEVTPTLHEKSGQK